MIVFVTGASGFVGRLLVSKLLRRLSGADRIYVLVRHEDSVPDEDPRLVRLHGDLEGIAVHSEILSRCNYVYHVGAIARFSGRFDYTAVNYEATRSIVDILAASDVLENLIFVSTIGAVDRARGDDCRQPITTDSKANPRSAYGRSKQQAEEYIRASRLPFTIVRPTWVYGPRMRSDSHINRFVSMVKSKAIATRFRFPGRVSVIHVQDLCEALVNALGNRNITGKTYLATTESVSLHEIFEAIRERGTQGRVRLLPPPPLVRVFRRFHHLLPLSLVALFLDYLWAEDPSFGDDFSVRQPILLKAGIREVIETNVDWSGWWVITGANSGLGLALARTLLSNGERVVAIDKSTDNLRVTEHQMVVKADLIDGDCLHQIAAKVHSIPVKCMVNNAGVGFRGDLPELSMGQLNDTIDVNVRAPILLTRVLARHLIRCNSAIVNIASSVAVSPLPHMSVYAATKSFLAFWSIALAEELRGTNAVVTVFPAGTATGFQSKAGVRSGADGELLDPSYVARTILTAVDKRQTTVMIGSKAKLAAVVSRLLPYSLAARLWGKAFELSR